tara:strand:+ start:2160 stop:3725 length:1566 start_codon:yes stop_codon:yes gene_type:complete
MGTGAGGASSYGGTGAGIEGIRGSGKAKLTKPIDKKTKSVTYSTDTPDLLLDLNSAGTANVSKTSPIQAVKVKNEGDVSAIAIFAFSKYEDETTLHGVEYVQYLLNPNDEILLPTTRAIIHDTYAEWDGTAVTATAPNSNEYVDSTANMDNATASGTVGSNSSTTLYLEPYSDEDDCTANLFQVGDLIRATNEIMEVTAIGNKTDLANNYITVRRGVHGSTAASDHSDGDAILLPFFNAYHDFDKYSVAQSDSLGRFKANNFFGYGRSASGQAGLTGGSIAIQFYEAGYAKAGLSDITSNTESGLTASTAYEFDITVDGGTTFDNLSFTVDSSNTKFGGSTGIIAKIQDALDTQYYTAGNLFEKKVTVTLEDGDIVFRSGSYLSTSAIAIGAGSSGTAEFLGTGRIPSAFTSYDAQLEADLVYDPVTNGSSYKNIFIRDDGYGNLIWKNDKIVGEINYESGAIDWTISERPNAEFVVSVLHTSPFSGKLDPTGAGRTNSLRQVLGNTPQQKCEAKLTVTTY